jgi:hypothetical protein
VRPTTSLLATRIGSVGSWRRGGDPAWTLDLDGSAPRVARAAARAYAAEREGVLVLIDPMSPPAPLVTGRELRVALTCPWHARSSPELGVPEIAVDARPSFYPDESVLWLAEYGALVFGDSFPGGRCPTTGFPKDKLAPTTARGSHRSSRCLALPVELVLPTQGDPGGRDLLVRVFDR